MFCGHFLYYVFRLSTVETKKLAFVALLTDFAQVGTCTHYDVIGASKSVRIPCFGEYVNHNRRPAASNVQYRPLAAGCPTAAAMIVLKKSPKMHLGILAASLRCLRLWPFQRVYSLPDTL
jgi:hypothetical protein